MSDKDKARVTKEKIMEAATEVFSEKGFEGARVDEIASRAKVNKAMIYYYFQSKENLFTEIIKLYLRECDALKLELKKEIDWNKDIEVEKYFYKIEKFMNNKKDIIRIILIDSIKSNSKEVSLLDTIMPVFQTRKEDLKNKNFNDAELTEILVNRFLFITIPWLAFLTIGGKWAQFLELDMDIVKKSFMKLFIQFQCEYYNSRK